MDIPQQRKEERQLRHVAQGEETYMEEITEEDAEAQIRKLKKNSRRG